MFNSSIPPQQKNSIIPRMDSISDSEDIDSEYKLFLKHLREDGKSYVLEMIDVESEMRIFVMYEKDNGSSDELESQSSGSTLGKGRRAYTGKRDRKSRKSGSGCCKDIGSLRLKSGKAVPKSSSCEHDNTNGELLVDDSYETFLSHVRSHGYSMTLELENGISVKYEEESEDSTALEGSRTKNDFHQHELGLSSHSTSQQPSDSSVYEDDGSSIECQPHRKSSYFMKTLMAVLNMPYDPNEHKRLWNEARNCKALHNQRVLRSANKSYPTQRPSMSYLDYYPELAKQIKDADDHRALTLLRGFFFWLKNLSHEGAFMPWRIPPSHDHDIIPIAPTETMSPIQIARPEKFKRQKVVWY